MKNNKINKLFLMILSVPPLFTGTRTSSWAIFRLYIHLFINQLWERIRINLSILNDTFPSHSPPLCALLQPEFMPRSLKITRAIPGSSYYYGMVSTIHYVVHNRLWGGVIVVDRYIRPRLTLIYRISRGISNTGA